MNDDGRDLLMRDVIPICAGGTFKPARVRLTHGEAELLLGMDIVKKLAWAVNFRGHQFKVGPSEWGMMTVHEKHRWVSPLAPTAFAYTKLNGYFGKFRDAEIEFLHAQGVLAKFYHFGKVPGRRNNEWEVKCEVPKRRFLK